MSWPTSATEFLDLVRNSGLIDASAVADCLSRFHPILPEKEPARVAGMLVAQGLLTSFQAEQILQGKWRRFTIGLYQVLEKIGSGNMGSVYLCKHVKLQRAVAVKVLPTAIGSDDSMVNRFYREARALASLDHVNTVRAFDVSSDDGLQYIAMEYVDGANLHDIVKRNRPLDVERAAHYIRQAALGLQHVHERGWVHRDIEPSNLVLDRGGALKIVDFGLARPADEWSDDATRPATNGALLFANPKYLAPEHALHNRGDARADLYSLGATLYFCLAGRSLFGGGTSAEMLLWHPTREPLPIQTLRPDVPDALADVVHRMLAKDPGQRFQAANEVADALMPWTEQPTAPPPDDEMPRFSPAAQRLIAESNRVF
jgi:serine/threonine protein kinase